MTTPAHDPAAPQASTPETTNGTSAAHKPALTEPAQAEIAPDATDPHAAEAAIAEPEPAAESVEALAAEPEAGVVESVAAEPELNASESTAAESGIEARAAEADAEREPEAVEPELEASDTVGDESAETEAEAAERGVSESVAVEPGSAVAELEVESEPEADGEPEAGSVESSLPDLTEEEGLHSALEALLLVVDSPAEVELLADALDQPVKRIRQALKTMAAGYAEQGRGIDLRDVGGGWRFYTRDKYAPFVEKLLLDGQRAKLTRAALESLAVIAYRQPVTRARVAAVRGVNVDGVVRTLLARGLIEETGTDKDTGGILYRTTELFLERLGLSSLEDLPPIAPLLPEVDAIDDV